MADRIFQGGVTERRATKILLVQNDVTHIFVFRHGSQLRGNEGLEATITLTEWDGDRFKDPTDDHPWDKATINAVVELARNVVTFVLANPDKKVAVLCQAGKNRSRTVALIAKHLLNPTLALPEDDKLPIDDDLKALVRFLYAGEDINDPGPAFSQFLEGGIPKADAPRHKRRRCSCTGIGGGTLPSLAALSL